MLLEISVLSATVELDGGIAVVVEVDDTVVDVDSGLRVVGARVVYSRVVDAIVVDCLVVGDGVGVVVVVVVEVNFVVVGTICKSNYVFY